MKERRRVGILIVFERVQPDCQHPSYAAGLSPEDLLFECGKYSRAVRWSKEQLQIITHENPQS